MSHEEQTDLRIQRTHKFLQEAMIELITEKGFDAITVGDIAERAMINRATFYRHYQDKYDLVAKIFEETANQLVENMKPLHKDPRHSATENPPEIRPASRLPLARILHAERRAEQRSTR